MAQGLKDLAGKLKEMVAASEKYETCMSLHVSEDGKAVELYLDTSINTYTEWIKGEGADIGLMRCQETHRVVGCRLPLKKNNLSVWHDGPLRINEGFLKEEG